MCIFYGYCCCCCLDLGDAVCVDVGIWSPFKEQIGYLHLSRSFPLCFSSFCSSLYGPCPIYQSVKDTIFSR